MNRTYLKSIVLTRFRPDKPSGGAALRNWQNIQCLGNLGPVDVVSIGSETANESIAGVRHWKAFSHTDMLRSRSTLERLWLKLWPIQSMAHPALASYYHKTVLSWLAGQMMIERYDLAVIEELSLALYLAFFKRFGCRTIYDAHNVEAPLRQRINAHPGIRSSLLSKRLFAAEQHVISQADMVWACSEYDSKAILETFSNTAPVCVVPNSVNVDSQECHLAALDPSKWKDRPLTILYPASFSYRPNLDAALTIIKELVPAIRKLGHNPRVYLVGRDPHPDMFSAAKGDEHIVITGSVESMSPYLSMPCVVALPISLGSGTRLKILEAFAASRPVVSTSKGCEGIDAIHGKHLLICDDVNTMAEKVIKVWNDDLLRRALTTAAFELVRERYSWQTAQVRIAQSIDLLFSPTFGRAS